MSPNANERIVRVSKLILLEHAVPICLQKHSVNFPMPQIDPSWFDQKEKEWGVWNMSEEEFAAFEQKKLEDYAKTLATVSPAFKDKVFTHVNHVMETLLSSYQ